MSLAVIVINWRDEARTLRCVASIRTWTTLAPELIVVDNESTNSSRKALSEVLAPKELIHSDVNLGFGGGNNRGIERALRGKSQYLFLLNSDARISQQAVIGLIQRLEAHPEISVLGPVIHEQQHDGERCYLGGRDISRSLSTRIAAEDSNLAGIPGYPLKEVDYVPGVALLARRAVFERVGLFDESYFFSAETADFCKRARDAGYDSFVDLEVSATHDARQTEEAVRETLYTYYSLRNRILYGRKHDRDRLGRHLTFWTAMCMLQFCGAAGGGQMRKARAILLALAHGLAKKSGNQNASFI